MSAKGSLKQARDPRFQALFSIRGVSKNAWVCDIDELIGQKGNKEFTDLVTVLNCNVGPRFDLDKLSFNKIIIASDADVDGLFIRSLLMTFFFKVFPDIIRDGRLFISEPPLYRINDKRNPFVINKEDYINRYIEKIIKDYKIGYQSKKDELQIKYFNKKELHDFLFDSSFYLDDMDLMIKHYKVNDRLLEMVLEEFININATDIVNVRDKINIQHLMNRIGEEFSELYFDDESKLIKGAVDGKHQLIEITDQLITKAKPLLDVMRKWSADENSNFILKNNKTATEYKLSLLGVLKILRKYQPDIIHRFKGLNSRPYLLNCREFLRA